MQPISNMNHPCTNPEIAVNMQGRNITLKLHWILGSIFTAFYSCS
jgi:hypothetical protein